MGESGARLFEESRGSIEEALRYVAFRRRLPPIEFQELQSYVSLKLIENDYAGFASSRRRARCPPICTS